MALKVSACARATLVGVIPESQDVLAASNAQERSERSGPDHLPLLRGELLRVIRKYVEVDADRIEINLESQDDHDVLELSVALPRRNAA